MPSFSKKAWNRHIVLEAVDLDRVSVGVDTVFVDVDADGNLITVDFLEHNTRFQAFLERRHFEDSSTICRAVSEKVSHAPRCYNHIHPSLSLAFIAAHRSIIILPQAVTEKMGLSRVCEARPTSTCRRRLVVAIATQTMRSLNSQSMGSSDMQRATEKGKREIKSF
jgi:hypothetical protein